TDRLGGAGRSAAAAPARGTHRHGLAARPARREFLPTDGTLVMTEVRLIRPGMLSYLLLLAVTSLPADDGAPARPKVVLTDAARRLHASCLVIDGHNDLP